MKYNTFTAARYGRSDVEISILRLDLATHRSVGNKHFKLKDNLRYLRESGAKRVLSFGGAWSNHLLALAQSTKAIGIQAVGVVRGDEGIDNIMLSDMQSQGMQLHFVSRAQYKLRHDTSYCEELCRELECDSYLPEGGSNQLAVDGCEEIAHNISEEECKHTRVVAAVGTGATLAGIIRGCPTGYVVTGVPVVNDSRVYERIQRWVKSSETVEYAKSRGASARSGSYWSLYNSPRRPAYAKPSRQLLNFVLNFYETNSVVLDPVYTGPAMAAVLSAEFLATIPSGERIVFVHTGGLAGAQGFRAQFEQCADPALVACYFDEISRLIQ